MSTPRREPVVAVTRDERADAGFSRMLSTLGARPLPLQTIAIERVKDTSALAAALENLEHADWIVFTSAHAVDAACGHVAWQRLWRRRPGRARVAAIGRATAAQLGERGVEVDLQPAHASAASLVEALRARSGDLRGARIIWPRSDVARRELPDALTDAGAIVTDPPAYRTVVVRPKGLAAFVRSLEAGEIDAVAFLSPSSALGLAASLSGGTLAPLVGRTRLASIGPTTTTALVTLGARADIEPAERTARALADAIVGAIRSRTGVTA